MKTVAELETRATKLQAELLKVEADKKAAAEQLRAEQIDQIAQFDELAESYRNQAAKAIEGDKALLYRYADDSEEQAYQLRKELGLLPDSYPAPMEREKADLNRNIRRINSMLIKAVCTLVAFMLADFTAGQIESGFISFALKLAAQLLFSLSALWGGLWFACYVVHGLLFGYSVTKLKQDWDNTNPSVRLAIVVVLIAAILQSLIAYGPNAK
jgi:hypothetical protein